MFKIPIFIKSIGLLLCLFLFALNSFFKIELWIISLSFCILFFIFDIIIHFYEKKSNLFKIIPRIPWKIPSFVVGMFVIVELLKHYHWIYLFGDIYYKFMEIIFKKSLKSTEFDFVFGIFGSVFTMTYLSSFACNIFNNQPMTILFTKMMNESSFKLVGINKFASMLSLIIGSNLGANISLIGALAGIMWNEILKQNEINIGYFKFMMYGLIITPIVIFFASLTLSIELIIFTLINPSN